MTQFKDKSLKSSANGTDYIPTGLLIYPTLMAADILLYDAKYVYVGMDQKQHIELTRNIAQRFNNKFGQTFVLPEHYYAANSQKILDLQNPTKKMSKSSESDKGTIFLLDDPKVAAKKIMSAITDNFNQVKYNPQKQPGITNLITIYSLISNQSVKIIEKKYQKIKNYGEFKNDVAQALTKFLIDFQKKYNVAYKNIDKYLKIVKATGKFCYDLSMKKINVVYQKMGLINKSY
jgi:tryptophanyl-tRNA synthetase